MEKSNLTLSGTNASLESDAEVGPYAVHLRKTVVTLIGALLAPSVGIYSW
jgi:hypothetical protein